MIDSIIYAPSFSTLVAELNAANPDMLQRDGSGAMVMPPVVTGFSRTPAAIRGDRVLVYARLSEADADKYRTVESMEVLAETEYTGKGTADRLYQMIFEDPEKLAKYDSVHQRLRTIKDPETGEEHNIRQDKFGILAGA